MESIDRDVFESCGPDDIDVRLYEDTDRPTLPKLPSVTTVLKTREDDKSNLHDWQDRNDGEGDNAYHKHLFWYSRHIGTLGHWFALRQLDPDLDWTSDEEESDTELKRQLSDDVTDDSPREVLYSVLRGDKKKEGGVVSSWGEFYDTYPPYKSGDFYREALYDKAKRDVQFFADAQARLWEKLGLSRLNVMEVEKFLFNTTHGYAGQVDLVYRDFNDNIVVADLKSSSGCYDKHQIQGAAYGKAVEEADSIDADTVDRLEVHRANPSTGHMVVHTHADAPDKQPIHVTDWWDDSYEDLWNEFHTLAQAFEFDSPE